MSKPLLPKQIIIKLGMYIKTLEPLSIGAGKSEVLPGVADIPVIRDPSSGLPIVPGSTLKGMFRGYLQRLLLAYATRKASNEYRGLVENFLNELFGSADDHASLIYFTDAFPEKTVDTHVRAHIKINPLTGGVQHGPFHREYVPRGAKFNFNVTMINTPPSMMYLLYLVAQLSSMGLVKIGGAKSRGYGQIELNINNVEFTLFTPFRNNSVLLDLHTGEVAMRLSDQKSLLITEKAGEEVSYNLPLEDLSDYKLFTLIKIKLEELRKLFENKEFTEKMVKLIENYIRLVGGRTGEEE